MYHDGDEVVTNKTCLEKIPGKGFFTSLNVLGG